MKKILSLIAGIAITCSLSAQDSIQEEPGYEFTNKIDIKTTSVKNQMRTGTCWAFAATSFVETELLRMGFGELDLSEMYFVRNAYLTKADLYVRYHGQNNFSQGGQAHDVVNEVAEHGFITEEAYDGLKYGGDVHVHGEMVAVIKGMLEGVVKNKNKKVTPVWGTAYQRVLDTYLGEAPANFEFEGKEYTPQAFVEASGFNPEDYIEITSYSHRPYYSEFVLEIPDNWSHDRYYNLPLDEFIQVFDYALENGYSICWDGDVSEKGFSHKNNLMILPEDNVEEMSGSDKERWENLSDKEKKEKLYNFKSPVPEKNVTEAMRQETFNNYKSTDDHLMHCVGRAFDQNGTKYYLIKNSWDDDSNDMGGNLYMSEAYARMKTIAIMIHKDALPKKIAKKLGVK